MNKYEVIEVIRNGETLTVEFKSDTKRLPDKELVAAVVALANTEGGYLFVGVEDDGTISGLHPNHQDIPGMLALIANRTRPPIFVQANLVEINEHKIALILISKSRQLVSTSDGFVKRHPKVPPLRH